MKPNDYRYISLYGGRGSSKTWHVAIKLIRDALSASHHRIYVGREYENSLRDSAYEAIESVVHEMGRAHKFRFQRGEIKCTSGSVFLFKGLEVRRNKIRGWEGATRTWVEEAQCISAATADVLIPTIFRRPDSQAIFTWNPHLRTDWVWERFMDAPRKGDLLLKVNSWDNPFLPPLLREERDALETENRLLWKHLWCGDPADALGDIQVLPYNLLADACQAWLNGLYLVAEADLPPAHAGLDIADGGEALNCIVVRRGPKILYMEKWPSLEAGILRHTAVRADEICRRFNVSRLFYDAGGVGSPIRADFREILKKRPERVRYSIHGIKFGDAVAGEKRPYSYGRANKDEFARRNAQMGWALRIRASKTARLLRGDIFVYPSECLFINPAIPNLNRYVNTLTKPTWENNPKNGRIVIDKLGAEKARKQTGDPPPRSPDDYDATALAFAGDSEFGLVAE